MKIAVLLPNWVGDTCMATPSLRALWNAPQVTEMVLVGKPGPMSVLEGLPYAADCLAYKPRSRTRGVYSRRQVAAELKRRRIDALLIFPNSLSTAMVGWLSRIPRRIGFAKNGRGWLLTDSIPLNERPSRRALALLGEETDRNWRIAPAIEFYLRIVKEFGVESTDKRMELAVREQDAELARQFLYSVGFDARRQIVLINNASGSSPSRLWPREHVVELAKRLAESGKQVLFHAGPGDREASLSFGASAGHPLVKSMGMHPTMPLGLSRGVIAMSDLVITTDSGPRHMAVALNRQVITLYGPTSPELTQTYNRPEVREELTMSCRACRRDECPLGHQDCMKNLMPDSVYRTASQLLSRSKKSEFSAA